MTLMTTLKMLQASLAEMGETQGCAETLRGPGAQS